jgi:hypothetical protein
VQNHVPDNAIFERVSKIRDKTYQNETEVLYELGEFDPHHVSSREIARDEITIPEDLRPETPSLIIAAGRQDARIYATEGSTMILAESLKAPNHRYSDAEGHFKIRGSVGVVRSGAPREYKRESIDRSFLQELQTYLKRINPDDFDAVYTFIPSYAKKSILGVFPHPLKEKIVEVAERNFYKAHPRELLLRIHEHETPQVSGPQQFKYK